MTCLRVFLLATLGLVAFSYPTESTAQQSLKIHQERPKRNLPSPPPRQPYNSMARDTTPFNCEQYRNHPHPGMKGFCEGMETMILRNEARAQGRPAPSASVIKLPSLGSEAARELGYACVGGQAFRKLPNGWEQLSAKDGGWQRCQGS